MQGTQEKTPVIPTHQPPGLRALSRSLFPEDNEFAAQRAFAVCVVYESELQDRYYRPILKLLSKALEKHCGDAAFAAVNAGIKDPVAEISGHRQLLAYSRHLSWQSPRS